MRVGFRLDHIYIYMMNEWSIATTGRRVRC